MATENFAGWRPKMEVAEELKISERTLERLIQRKRIRRAYRRVPGRKPLAVLNPDDVARLKSETLAPLPVYATSGCEVVSSLTTTTAPLPALIHVAEGVLDVLHTLAHDRLLSQQLMLSLAEASRYSGLSQAYLRQQIKAGKLRAVRDGEWKVSRMSLEKLAQE